MGLVGCKPASQQPTGPKRTSKPAAVVVEGFAVLGSDPAAAREAAVANALHLAVEQRCGLLLEGSRTTENYVLVRYRVHSRTEGMVDSYKILEEKAENGVYRVKLSVVFRRDVVKAAGLDKLRLALAASGSYLDGGRRVSSDEVAGAVKTALVQSGIKLSFVDAGLTPTSSERAMKAAARTQRLDLVVLLNSEARQQA